MAYTRHDNRKLVDIPRNFAAALTHRPGNALRCLAHAVDLAERQDKILFGYKILDRRLARKVYHHRFAVVRLRLASLGTGFRIRFGLFAHHAGQRILVNLHLKSPRAQAIGYLVRCGRPLLLIHHREYAAAGCALYRNNQDPSVLLRRERENMILILDESHTFFCDFFCHGLVFRTAERFLHHRNRRDHLLERQLVQLHVRFQAENPLQSLLKAFLCNHAVFVAVHHVPEILIQIVEEQEHIASGGNRGGKQIAALHHAGQADHVGRIRQDHAVKSELSAQKSLEQLRAERGGHYVLVADFRIDGAGPGGLHDVTGHDRLQAHVDQALVDLAVGIHPGVAVGAVDTVGQVLIPFVKTVAGEMLRGTREIGIFMRTLEICLRHAADRIRIIRKAAR